MWGVIIKGNDYLPREGPGTEDVEWVQIIKPSEGKFVI